MLKHGEAYNSGVTRNPNLALEFKTFEVVSDEKHTNKIAILLIKKRLPSATTEKSSPNLSGFPPS